VERISKAAAARLAKIYAERTMRTKGLVWAVALSLSLTGRVGMAQPAGSSNTPDAAPPASMEFVEQTSYDGNVACYSAPGLSSYLYAGAEMSLLHVQANPVASTVSTVDIVANPGTDFALSTNGDFTDWGYAPRLWIGAHLTENWNIEGRFWHLRDSDTNFPVATNLGAPTDDIFIEHTSVEAYTVDIDAIRTFNRDRWKFAAQLGARHGHFSAENFVSGSANVGPVDFGLASMLGGSFNGTGFSYGGTIKHSIGGSNLSWVTSARGSYMWGKEQIFTLATIDSPSGDVTLGNGTPVDAELAIGELQTGVEWNYALTVIPANAFVRASYELQNWNVSGPIRTTGIGGSAGGVDDAQNFRSGLGELTLNGVSIAAGINW
jgi:hypothetical protein